MADQTEDKLFEELETTVTEVTAMGAVYKPPGAGAKVAVLQANLAEAQAFAAAV